MTVAKNLSKVYLLKFQDRKLTFWTKRNVYLHVNGGGELMGVDGSEEKLLFVWSADAVCCCKLDYIF